MFGFYALYLPKMPSIQDPPNVVHNENVANAELYVSRYPTTTGGGRRGGCKIYSLVFRRERSKFLSYREPF